MNEKNDNHPLDIDGRNLDRYEQENLDKAKRLIKNRSLVKYKITNEDLNIIFDLKAIDSAMGIVIGNVKYKEIEWVYESDLYGTGQTPPKKIKGNKKNKRNKVNEIFDYLFGAVTGDGKGTEPAAPSLSIDSLIDRALAKLTNDLSYYEDPFWTAEQEEKELSESLHEEASKLSSPPNEETDQEDELTGWVRVAWPDKSITTIEHVSFLEELGSSIE